MVWFCHDLFLSTVVHPRPYCGCGVCCDDSCGLSCPWFSRCGPWDFRSRTSMLPGVFHEGPGWCRVFHAVLKCRSETRRWLLYESERHDFFGIWSCFNRVICQMRGALDIQKYSWHFVPKTEVSGTDPETGRRSPTLRRETSRNPSRNQRSETPCL